ncbi:inorganic diphosphatase [Hymenobacter taeanensis]|uniref:inorganic diphosphatase n=1 Tax=Hymenobacter taeanensis TaxID=2735321 RepID=A0A6M6BD70_9BACT|nr:MULTISPECIES: inorganic diphosphatase [Hymenobacter]QJX45880.1 inorganic diphosphatase [Hymenobacter taeanensis]UOQ79725.1 inorganic diphosphatase [Hymenobacter sp. 5414T-23]
MRASGLIFGVLVSSLGLVAGCRTDYADLPTYSKERRLLQVVVEVPAGTNHEQYYDPAAHEFKPSQQAGIERVVEFLPFPGNYGFIPGTRASASASVLAEQPLQALVLAESEPAGTILEVIPIGVVLLDVDGTMEQTILAVPARPGQRILPDVADWATLMRRYPAVRQALGLWFQHRNPSDAVRIAGWKDEKYAEQQIKAQLQ